VYAEGTLFGWLGLNAKTVYLQAVLVLIQLSISFGVITCRKNLEMLGNLTVIW